VLPTEKSDIKRLSFQKCPSEALLSNTQLRTGRANQGAHFIRLSVITLAEGAKAGKQNMP
jgi:hypothetical protein